MPPIVIPKHLVALCQRKPERAAWLESLPRVVSELVARWSLTFNNSPNYEGGCAWVVPALRADGTPAVLKLGMPHMEAEHEILGLRFWDGNPTVRVLESDKVAGAMLLERCSPGTSLRELPEPEQDGIIAGLLRRLWRRVPSPHPFRPLSVMVEHWVQATLADAKRWTDPGLVMEGLATFAELSPPRSGDVLLATDLHAGNVLRAEREPWLAIDPKPFVGDPCYDATQHLFNCQGRVLADPAGTVRRIADLLEVDSERVRLWAFARAAAEPRDDWEPTNPLARALRV
ncbi:MAG TPA: aminoglycoside phosphotransferase family protein [Gemmatimonadales bacterium]|jgi:streptomycin 6-kinase|nr:aminoglycoside phosphotransferase family protein [Gemmatimonadales bacterium]